MTSYIEKENKSSNLVGGKLGGHIRSKVNGFDLSTTYLA